MAAQLDNLVKIGQLKIEPPAQIEVDGLIRSGSVRLIDAGNVALSLASRFDLAYNAAHAMALAALRLRGYRSENRYTVFQVLVHTVALPNEQMRVLDQAHVKRNRSEYEGDVELDAKLIEAVCRVASEVEKRVLGLRATTTFLSPEA